MQSVLDNPPVRCTICTVECPTPNVLTTFISNNQYKLHTLRPEQYYCGHAHPHQPRMPLCNLIALQATSQLSSSHQINLQFLVTHITNFVMITGIVQYYGNVFPWVITILNLASTIVNKQQFPVLAEVLMCCSPTPIDIPGLRVAYTHYQTQPGLYRSCHTSRGVLIHIIQSRRRVNLNCSNSWSIDCQTYSVCSCQVPIQCNL